VNVYAKAIDEARRLVEKLTPERRAEIEMQMKKAYEWAEDITDGRRDPLDGISF